MAVVKTRYAKLGAGQNIAGITHASVGVQTKNRTSTGGATTTGIESATVTYYDVTISIFGNDWTALLPLFGVAAANLVVGYQSSAGTNKKKTLKNAKFVEWIKGSEIPRKDGGGKVANFGIRAHGCWGASDTLALMLVDAADP